MAFALQGSCPLRPAKTFVPRSPCARVPQDLRRTPITLAAPFGVGSVPNEPDNGESSSSKVLVPEDKTWGLSPRQMAALGITGEFAGMGVRGEHLTARASWGEPLTKNRRIPATMRGASFAKRKAKPPDLPSLLFDSRIVYIGMPLVTSVMELVMAELLYLNYNAPDKPVYLYLNSIGNQTPRGETIAFETECYAIMDTLNYITPDIHTLAIGQTLGNAVLLLASGKKGCRYAMPNARIMTGPPRMNRSFGPTKDMMIKANELEYNMQEHVRFMTKFTGRDPETVRKDLGRNRYFTPQTAIEYGIVDKVVSTASSRELMEYQARQREQVLTPAQYDRRRYESNELSPASA